MYFGILKSNTNTGADNEILNQFATPLQVVSNQPIFSSDTLSLRRVTSDNNVQRWEIEAQLSPSNEDAGFLAHNVLKGHSTVFPIRMPQVFKVSDPEYARFGSVSSPVNSSLLASALVGATTISAANLTVGEFIRFETLDTKVYLVVGVSGNTVSIFPGLLKAQSSAAKILRGLRVTMLARYDTDVVLGIKFTDGVLSDPGSVKFVEAL